MDKIFIAYFGIFVGFMAGNAATMFLTHWLHAVMAAFGKGPVSAPHRIDVIAALMMTLLHPVPYMLLIGAWFGTHRLIFGPAIPQGWRWFWVGVGCWAIFVAALSALTVQRMRKARAKISAT